MTVLNWPAGQTPYVTPDQLYTTSGTVTVTQWPVGAQWATIPFTSGGTVSATAAASVLSMICQAATLKAELICNQPLRATESSEELEGPDFRVTFQQHTGNGRIICSRWPILQVTSVAISPNATWPRQWTTLPAAYYEPEMPAQGLYNSYVSSGAGGGAQSVIFSPGYMNWALGRNGYRVKVSYVAGWPHTCLTTDGTAGATTITVDDCTGWAPVSTGTPGAAGMIYDAAGGGQEPVNVTAASAASGPGTLTLAAATTYAHTAGVMVSSLPQGAIWATALLAGEAALARGAQATTIQTTGGRRQAATGSMLEEMAKDFLRPLERTI